MISVKLPSLDSYDDFRAYLHDLIEEAARSSEKISMQRFAQAFGLSRSHLSMVLSGERALTLRNIHGIAEALHMKHRDHEYWEALVLLGQAKDDKDRSYYKMKLEQQRASRNTKSITAASKVLTSEWYVPAVLVYLIDIGMGEADFDQICKRLSLTRDELQKCIKDLEAEGFLTFRGQGDIHISFNRLVSMISNKRYLKKVFQEGVDRMDANFASNLCLYNGTTFTLAEDDIHQFISDYKSLLDRYLNSCGKESKRVVQANIQFFPVI